MDNCPLTIDVEPTIDIKGISKVQLLQHLWENTSIPGLLGFLTPSIPFSKHGAEEAVKRDIDYYQGRPIKCDISGDTAYTRLYDRDSSKSFKDIVNDIREKIAFNEYRNLGTYASDDESEEEDFEPLTPLKMKVNAKILNH